MASVKTCWVGPNSFEDVKMSLKIRLETGKPNRLFLCRLESGLLAQGILRRSQGPEKYLPAFKTWAPVYGTPTIPVDR